MKLIPPFGPGVPDIKMRPTASVTNKTKRNRASKLDPHFNFIATSLLENSRMQTARNSQDSKTKHRAGKVKSLDAICETLQRKHGVSAVKSTLSRFINKHPLLKML